jgi:NAD kinase
VLGGGEIVEVQLGESERMTLSGDGILNVDVAKGDRVRISLDKKNVNVITLDYSSYFEVLRRKLHWGEDNGSFAPPAAKLHD